MQTDVPYNKSRYRQHCKCNVHKINEINAFLLVLPCLLSPLGPITGRMEFVPSLRISLPVTPGLILMLNYFSFANDVARLQSACLNMYGGLRGENRFYGDADPSLSLSLPQPAPLLMTLHSAHTVDDWVCLSLSSAACVCVGQGLAPRVTVCVCDCVCACAWAWAVTLHLVGPHSVITSTNAEYAWLHS